MISLGATKVISDLLTGMERSAFSSIMNGIATVLSEIATSGVSSIITKDIFLTLAVTRGQLCLVCSEESSVGDSYV